MVTVAIARVDKVLGTLGGGSVLSVFGLSRCFLINNPPDFYLYEFLLHFQRTLYMAPHAP